MIVHVVMWKFNKNINGEKTFKELKEALESLLEKIPDLNSIEVGSNFNMSDGAWDMVLRSSHKDKTALENYRIHPAHVAVAKQISSVVKERAVVDYSTE